MAEQQLIDAEGEFTGSLYVPPASATSRQYGVVAVIGCQSGGKSTLLNAAFGTHFPVLDAAVSGRRRTTLGVWGAITATPHTAPLVVLDIEGADSRERGDGARAFESRTALLALALSDVVVVNMWAHDVGRYSAANYDLFETVFAHAARLRAGGALRRRVRILIAVRDHDAHAPLEQIQHVLLGDLGAIWDALHIRSASFDDLFAFEFAALPHMKYAAEEFALSVSSLAEDVRELVDPDEIGEKDVPLSAFEALSGAVWAEVRKATGGTRGGACALDLPKHAALASHFHVGQILERVLAGPVSLAVDALRDEIESEWRTPVESFDARVANLVEDALKEFDDAAAPFSATPSGAPAVEARRNEVGAALLSRVNDLRERYLWVCRESSLAAFEEEFRPMLGGTAGFARASRRLVQAYIDKYRKLLESARYPSALLPFLEEQEAAAEDPDDIAGSDPASDGVGGNDMDGPLLMAPDEGPSSTFAALAALDEDSDNDDGDEFALERFAKDINRMVEDRKRMGELMLPGALGITQKQPPWWKGLLIRGAILLINYLQASQGHRAALKLQRQHEKEFPPTPTF